MIKIVLAAALVFMVARHAMAMQAGSADTATGEGEQGGGVDLSGVLYGAQNMIDNKRISAAGLEALKMREGFRSAVYLDTAGKETIGYGHLLRAWENFDGGITEAQAAALLADDVAQAEDAVAALVIVPITQDQFDSLVSFAFNVGVSAFRNSTLLGLLNSGNYDGAREQFARWVYVTRAGERVADAGLKNRRLSEMIQFV